MKKRILSALLVFALLFSLCPPTALAAVSRYEGQTLRGQSLTFQNPLYPDAVYASAQESASVSLGTSATSSTHYGTVEEVAMDIRDYMKSRTETFTVYMHYVPTSSDQEAIEQEIKDAIYSAFDLAMAHTGVPTEGDYIRWQWGNTSMEWSGAPSSNGFDMTLTFTLEYFTTAAQELEMDKAVAALLEELDLDHATDYQKLWGIYDYICQNVTYDYDNLPDKSNTLKNTAYAALINGTSVCQGYATLFYRLALELGVDARLIVGSSSGQDHSWNIVKLDGLYYNVDATFDSNLAAEGLDYQYFLISDANFRDHIRSEDYASEAFYAEYPMAVSDYEPGDSPAPSEPEPTETTPTEPEPTETTPTEPEPTETTPTEPEPTETTPTEPEPTETTPTEPEPTETTPTEPEPTETTPTKPEPTETTPTEPDPTETTPTEPEPTETTPTEPEPTETAPSEPEETTHVHTEEIRNAKDPTCTDHGYSGDVYCSECGELLRAGEQIPCTGHSYGKWIIEAYPSGGSDGGRKAHYCTVCGIGEFSHIGIGEEDHPNGYPVTVTCNAGGGYTQAIYKADPGHEVVLTVTPSRGAYLADIKCTSSDGVEVAPPHFYGDNGEYIIITMPDGPLNIELIFAYYPDYKVNVTASVGGTASVDLETAYEGETIVLQAQPETGYAVVSVEVVSSGTYDAALTQETASRFIVTMPDGDIDIIVTFDKAEDHPIEVYTTVGGNAYTSVSSAHEGEHFTLTVAPDPGYQVDQVYTYTDGTYAADGWEIGTNEFEIVMADGPLTIEVSFVLSSSPFVDVKETDYYHNPVLWAVTHGITSGVSANRFGPGNPCTRAQVVTFLWRAAGSPEPTSDYNPFTDVSESNYYYNAVLWAVENGITSGTSSTTFGPSRPCTRAQVVTFLWRACGSPNPSSYDNPFTDVKETDYFYKAVLFAVEYGITSGMSNTLFGSSNTCTRAHVVTFLYKALHG